MNGKGAGTGGQEPSEISLVLDKINSRCGKTSRLNILYRKETVRHAPEKLKFEILSICVEVRTEA